MSILVTLILAVAATMLPKKVSFFQNADAKAMKLVRVGFWCKFALSAAAFLLSKISGALDGEELTKYLGRLLSDFSGIGSVVAFIGIFLILSAVAAEKYNQRLNSKMPCEDETVLFTADSAISAKVNENCRKVFRYGSIVIAVLNGYNALRYVFNSFKWLDMNDLVSDFYYAVNTVPFAVRYVLMSVLVLMIVLFAICLNVKSKLVVTDRRVYGFTSFGRAFDVDYDKITGVTVKGNSGISIATGLSSISVISAENREDAIALIRPNIKPQENITIEIAEESSDMFTVNPLLKQAFCKVSKVILLSVVTFGIYQFVWIYKMTKALNLIDEKEQRDPTKTILMCLFIPLYTVWWFYKSAAAVKKLENAAGIKSDIGVLCPIFGMLLPLFAVALIQDSLNRIIG